MTWHDFRVIFQRCSIRSIARSQSGRQRDVIGSVQTVERWRHTQQFGDVFTSNIIRSEDIPELLCGNGAPCHILRSDVNQPQRVTRRYVIPIKNFSHLKLCLATAIHNFKWQKMHATPSAYSQQTRNVYPMSAQCFFIIISLSSLKSVVLRKLHLVNKMKIFCVKISIVGSFRDREVACSASDRQGSNFESCVWRTVSSQSSHHPQEALLAQFSVYVHKSGLKLDSFSLSQHLHCIFIITNLNYLQKT